MHWKKLYDYRFLGCHDFEKAEEITLTIARIEKEDVFNPGDNQSENVPVVYWVEKNVKPLILKPTNSKNISSALKSAEVEDWIGRQVTLFCDPTVKVGREVVGGVRIRPFPPKKRDTKIDDLKAAIRAEIPKYNGTDKAEIVAKLKEDAANGTETIETLSAALKKLRS